MGSASVGRRYHARFDALNKIMSAALQGQHGTSAPKRGMQQHEAVEIQTINKRKR